MGSPRPTGSDSVQRSDGGPGRFLSRQEATSTYVQLAAGLATVTHNADATAARPSAAVVYWLGTVRPNNIQNQDIWFNPAAGVTNYEPLNGTAARAVSSGEATIDRTIATDSLTITTGSLRLTYFTATKTETVNKVRGLTALTAGTSTTLARVGIYQEDPTTGALTLVASTANDTTLWSVAQTQYDTSLSASLSKVAGTRYAVGRLWVGTGTSPTLRGITDPGGMNNEWALAPRLSAVVAGQSDLPASITAGSLTNSAQLQYAVLHP